MFGAPQQHGQNRYKQNIGIEPDLTLKKLIDDGYGYSKEALAENGGEFMYAGRGNQNTAKISESSQSILDAGGQHWQMYSIRDGVDRHERQIK